MDPEPDAQSPSLNSRLAEFLCEQREAIIGEWLGKVRTDPRIPTDPFPTEELVDHLPRVLDNLADLLRLPSENPVEEQLGKDAQKACGRPLAAGIQTPRDAPRD